MKVWGLGLALVVAMAVAGCGETECGPGTIRSGALCVPADVSAECPCGPGTHLDPVDGRCTPDEQTTVCGINTEECTDDAGVVLCVGPRSDCPRPAGCE